MNRRHASSGACQRWLDGTHSWRHVSDGGFDPRSFRVVPIPEQTARQFVTRHHYSGSFPAARLSYGLLTADGRYATEGTTVAGLALAGVAVLSVPMSDKVLTNVFPDLEPHVGSVELGRFVLTDTPANTESWMLARVFELAADAGVRGVVSFSDPMPRTRTVLETLDDGAVVERREQVTPGHVGIIYQSLNAVACGRSTARTLTYLPRQGLVLPDRTLQKIRGQEPGADPAERRLVELGATPRRAGEDPRTWLSTALEQLGVVKVRHPGNFRYAFTLGPRRDRRRTRIAPPPTRYPKQVTDLLPAA